MQKHKYSVEIAGFFFGSYQAKGTAMVLYPKAAKYEVLQGNLKDLGPAGAPGPAAGVKIKAKAKAGSKKITETAGA